MKNSQSDIMKAYKATYNFKCHDQEYKVGKTYTSDKMKMCHYGIHFCQNMSDVINYYPHSKDFVLLEIEVLGNIETDGNKSVTDKIKVLRVVPEEEYTFPVNTFEYDDRGNMISMTTPYGNKWTYEYDDRNNMISETFSSGGKSTFEYDDRGNMISATYPNGDNHTFEYDDRGNMISATYPNGGKSTFEYDDRGNMISKIYPNGGKSTYEVAIITESE